MKRLLFILSGLLFAQCVQAAESIDLSVLPQDVERVDIYLLLGQSNMKGRGDIPAEQTTDPLIVNMNMENDLWYEAEHPLHKAGVPDLIDGSDNAGVGPGLDFAKTLLSQTNGVRIALVPCAIGGSWINLWQPGRDFYTNAIYRAQKALADAPPGVARIKGVLWLQGESDSTDARYAAYSGKLSTLVQSLRADLNEPDLPFIACTIGTFINSPNYPRVQEINYDLLSLPQREPYTACVDARDLSGHIGDNMHYNTASQEIIGARFAAEYAALTESPTNESDIVFSTGFEADAFRMKCRILQTISMVSVLSSSNSCSLPKVRRMTSCCGCSVESLGGIGAGGYVCGGLLFYPRSECGALRSVAELEWKRPGGPFYGALEGNVMSKIRIMVLAASGLASCALAQYAPKGELQPFWRYSAALGGWNANNPDYLAGGQRLQTVPDYMLSGNDFAYQKRPYAQEGLFADHLSVVRFLGGYLTNDTKTVEEISELDLVYRDNGVVKYRMELVKSRLRPYLDAGYTNLTLVFDNIPWGMTDAPEQGNHGNVGIPYDFDVWEGFVEELCFAVSNVCGEAVAENVRFRTGTEFQSIRRYHGSSGADFMNYYNASWRGISNVFPNAQMGPFNIAGARVSNLDNNTNINAFNIPALKDNAAPFDWVAYSHYFLPGEGPGSLLDPFVEVWEEFESRYPGIQFDREIHEFGIQPWTNVDNPVAHAEPGALGIATTLQTLLGLWNEGLDRCWHWDVLEKRGNKYIPYGNAWIYSVLDRMKGGDAHYLTAVNSSAFGTHWTGMSSMKADEALILLNAYNQSEAEHTPETATFRIPKDPFAPLELDQLKYAAANQSTVVHDLIRDDLAQSNLLASFFVDNPELCGSIKQMAADGGIEYIFDKIETYEQAWDESLTLKPISERACTVTDQGSYYEISIELNVPEALVIHVPLREGGRRLLLLPGI